jgi:RNA polymerase sigma-70 factor (ECF subfamily)
MMIDVVAADDDALRRSAEFTAQLDAVLDPAYRLATVMLRDRSAAEDAVQEAALKAWRKHGQLRGGAASFRPWFLSIVANECRMARRTSWWRVLRLPELPEPAVPSSEMDVSSGDLREAVLRLEPRDRAALFCFFYLDLPMEEVARVLGVSPTAARSRVYRAARRLRPELESEEDL